MTTRDIFLCHASADKEPIARPLYGALKSVGVSVWFDEAEIGWGESIVAKIQEGLMKSSRVLALLSWNFVAPGGAWRLEELNSALADQIDAKVVRVLPLLVDLGDAELRKKLPFLSHRRFEKLPCSGERGERVTQDFEWAARKVRAHLDAALQPLLLARDELGDRIGSVLDRLAKATSHVMFSGTDCKTMLEAHSGQLEEVLKRGVRVSAICVDPESAAAAMLPSIDPRFPNEAAFRDSMASVLKVLRRLRLSYGELFSYRLLPILPAIAFFISDPGLATESIKVEICTPRPWSPIPSRPHLILGDALREWRVYFLAQWENYWNLSHPE